jgi:hypothetical protein
MSVGFERDLKIDRLLGLGFGLLDLRGEDLLRDFQLFPLLLAGVIGSHSELS